MQGHGGVDGHNPNDILDKELAEKQKKSIVIVPSVYVNNVVQRGALSANNVLSSICAGYLAGTQPPVCNCVNAPPDKVTKCVKVRELVVVYIGVDNTTTGKTSTALFFLFFLCCCCQTMGVVGNIYS